MGFSVAVGGFFFIVGYRCVAMNGILAWEDVSTILPIEVDENGRPIVKVVNVEKRLVLKSELRGCAYDADFGVVINARVINPDDLSGMDNCVYPVYIKRCGSADGTGIMSSKYTSPAFQEEGPPPHEHGWFGTFLLILSAVNDRDRAVLLAHKEDFQECSSIPVDCATIDDPPGIINMICQIVTDNGEVLRYVVAINSEGVIVAILSAVLVAVNVEISTVRKIETATSVLRRQMVSAEVSTMVSMLKVSFADEMRDVYLEMSPYYRTIH